MHDLANKIFPQTVLALRGSGGFSSGEWKLKRVRPGFVTMLSYRKFPIKLDVEAPNATRNGRPRHFD